MTRLPTGQYSRDSGMREAGRLIVYATMKLLSSDVLASPWGITGPTRTNVEIGLGYKQSWCRRILANCLILNERGKIRQVMSGRITLYSDIGSPALVA